MRSEHRRDLPTHRYIQTGRPGQLKNSMDTALLGPASRFLGKQGTW